RRLHLRSIVDEIGVAFGQTQQVFHMRHGVIVPVGRIVQSCKIAPQASVEQRAFYRWRHGAHRLFPTEPAFASNSFLVLRSTKAASSAVRVIPARSVSDRPKYADATSYSRFSEVLKCGGSSEFSVTLQPAARS